jgi:hypothetical protein
VRRFYPYRTRNALKENSLGQDVLKVIELRQLVDARSLFLLGPRGREIDPFG